MAVYDLEEQEKLANIKGWWQQHGNRILWVAIIVLAVAAAWQGWNWHKNAQARAASTLMGEFTSALQAGDSAKAEQLSGQLTEEFSGTAQADLSTLFAAKAAIDKNDLKTARARLDWAVRHADKELADLARLRLAGVLLDEKAYDEALALLAQTPAPAFAALYADLKGDVLVAQNKAGEARAAYEAALKALGDDPQAADGQEEAGKAAEAKKISDPALAALIRQKLTSLPKGAA
ncbi:MAG: tetratricopeptide repeat protein [Zoogloeaceae bacterium]|nr:tetratricopeptide repeat protein [Zoogloeaceae bacterium]